MVVSYIPLNEEETPQDTISLTPESTIASLPPSVVERRAGKYDFTLQGDSPGIEELVAQLSSGGDDALRAQLAHQRAEDRLRAKYIMLQDQLLGRPRDIPQTQQDVDDARFLSQGEEIEPLGTIFEKAFSERYLDSTLGTAYDNPELNQELQTPDGEQKVNGATNLLTFKQGLYNLIEETQAKADNVSFGKGVSDAFEIFVPGLEAWRVDDVDLGQLDDSFLPGNDIKDKALFLGRLAQADPDEALRRLRDQTEELFGKNSITALNFLRKLNGYTSTEQFVDNIFGAVDLAAITPIGVTVKAGKALILGKFLKDAYKAARPKIDVTEVLDEVGDITLASHNEVKKQLFQSVRGERAASSVTDLFKNTIALHDPTLWLRGTTRFSAAETQQLQDSMLQSSRGLMESFLSLPRINRLNEQQLDQALDVVRKQIETETGFIEGQIKQIVPFRSAEDSVSNTDLFEIVIGNKTGLYSSRQTAENVAKKYFDLGPEAKVKQRGGKYYISVVRAADENNELIRDLSIVADSRMKDDSFINTIIGLARTPNETLPKALVNDRLVATVGSQRLLELVSGLSRGLGGLGIGSRKRLRQYLVRQRATQNPDTGIPGVFDKNIAEFEQNWHKMHGKYPTVKETNAYANYVLLNDGDWVMRNFSLRRDKLRQGINNYSFRIAPRANSPQIEGKAVDGLPAHGEEAGILFVKNDGSSTFLYKEIDNAKVKKTMKELDGTNRSILQLTPTGEQTLKEIESLSSTIGNRKVNFVVTQSGVKTHGLPLQHIPFRPGGHIVYPQGFFLSQANIAKEFRGKQLLRERYEGDTAILQFSTLAQAKKFQPLFEKARQLLKANKHTEFDDYVTNNLPLSPSAFRKMFDDGKLSLNEPLLINASGESLIDAHPIGRNRINFFDSSKSQYNLYDEANLRFAGRRDQLIPTVKEGSKNNTLVKLRPTDLIDPLVVADRSAASLINNAYLDDIKLKTASQFVTQFKHLFKNEDFALRNPVAALLSDPKQLFKDGLAKSEELAAAKIMSRTAREFLNINTAENNFWLYARQKLADTIYKTGGQRAVDLTHSHVMNRIKDPISYARGLVFDSSLGLFQPLQLFLQAQSLVHVAGVNGLDNALRSFTPTYLMLGLRRANLADNPQILDHFASLSAKSGGLKAHEFKESWLGLQKSGWMNIGGEVSYIDSVFEPNIVTTGFGRVRDFGRIFFKTGERLVRVAAWNSAYAAWRKANPLAKFTPKVQKEILGRADDLSVNMTSASNASWQKGFTSIPTQFFSYTSRLAEQMLGKRLTGAEKRRALALYATVYGVPVAGGMTIAAPLNDFIKQKLLENNIEYDDTVAEVFMDGVAGVALEWITGTDFDISRYSPEGPGPLSLIWDYFQGEKELWEILTGAMGTRVGAIASATDPFLRYLGGIVDTENDTDYPLTTADLREALASIASSFNNFSKSYMALSYGQYYSRKETLIDSTTPLETIFIALTGLEPEMRTDAFRANTANKEMTEHLRTSGRVIRQNMIRLMRALSDNNQKEAEVYGQRIKAVMIAVPLHKAAEVMADATRNLDETLVSSAYRRFLLNNPQGKVAPHALEERKKEIEGSR